MSDSAGRPTARQREIATKGVEDGLAFADELRVRGGPDLAMATLIAAMAKVLLGFNPVVRVLKMNAAFSAVRHSVVGMEDLQRGDEDGG